MKIKKGDTVLVNAGKSKGKTSKIEAVFPKNRQAIVAGINSVKKHLKPTRANPHGGIIDKVMPIDASNLTVICPHCNKPTRVGYKTKGEIKIRICRKCQENLDAK